MELVPSTVLKAEYAVFQTTIYQQYQPQSAPDPAHETSLWSVFEAFLVDNSATIVAEITEGAISATAWKRIIEQFATSGECGHDLKVMNTYL